jgi:hypothetical protein
MDVLSDFWLLLEPAHEFIYSVGLAAVTALLFWLFRAQVKVIWGRTSLNFHNFVIAGDSEPVHVATQKFFVQNLGRRATSSIEIVFSAAPTSYNLWPPRDHRKTTLDNGQFSLNIPSIAPGELIIIDTVDIELGDPRILSVNCPDTISSQVDFVAQRKFARWVYALVAYLMLAGLVGTAYLALNLFVG